ncbi:50S ribosomal protein L3 [Candidatus Thiothrix anitrata]|jgi:large subunit ribosomal protein L3|uniref:Large ribosomal subunit protein uL3 n=1 Tax=Candidatus Thiothrix anitrata TaxID=2823902 RepID=A0ABX7X7P6_9GAMM|nr:50S ribosomal protein L3 [Candidatus Thiothrix anitrata]QTR51373.1 50S ribosomal protein L3 [Candidatus Thiothrix anitrata]
MAIGLLGRKVGMTRIYGEDGGSTPVTVLEIAANRVSQVKTAETDGYTAIQLSVGEKKSSRVSKSAAGHFAKAGVPAGTLVRESRTNDVAGYELGSELAVTMFEAGQKVDVTGVSKGKGFQGVLKRYHFAGQDRTHGNSLSHRAPGSIGQNQTPGRVFPGKKMSGHMGAVQRTSQNLEVVRVDAERNLLLVKGAVPGANNGDVVVKLSVKA